MKIIIIGLGNPILGDDGVGWKVAEEVEKQLAPSSLYSSSEGDGDEEKQNVEIECVSLGGLRLMELLAGAGRAILIDSICTGQNPVGTVSRFTLAEMPDLTAGHSASAHDTSLRNALDIGRKMQIPLPQDEQVIIVAVEAQKVYDFTEELSPVVSAAVPQAVKVVLELIS